MRTLNVGDNVKLYFRNGYIVSGTILSWNEVNGYIIKSDDEALDFHIQNIEDIFLAKVFLQENGANEKWADKTLPPLQNVEKHEQARAKIKKMPRNEQRKTLIDSGIYNKDGDLTKEYSDNQDHLLRVKKLAELHKIKANHEREMVKKKLTQFESTGNNNVQYGTPDFRKL